MIDRRLLVLAALLVAVIAGAARAAAPPVAATQPAPVAGDFASEVDLSTLGQVAVYDEGRLHSFESFARRMLRFVSGPHRIDDQPLTFTYLDLIIRPHEYHQRPIIYVKKKPIRAQIIAALERSPLASRPGFADDLDRFLETGLIAPPYLEDAEVISVLNRMRQDLIRTARFVDEIDTALAVRQGAVLLGAWRVLPPAGTDDQKPWFGFDQLMMPAAAGDGLAPDTRDAVSQPWQDLINAWMDEDAAGVNDAASRLAAVLPTLNPTLYPASSRAGWPWSFGSESVAGWTATIGVGLGFLALLIVSMLKGWTTGRRVAATMLVMLVGLSAGALWLGGQSPLALETFYFRAYNLTWFWVFYALSLVPLLLGVVFRWSGARWVGLALFIGAFAAHSGALLLRWYVSDRWPNSNMFEAVTTAAWFGGVGAIVLESVAGRTLMRNLFALGSAAASMVALMCAFYLPLELDAGISNRMPVLHDVWLYIHTNVIIFSYCLIFMAAVSALLYLGFRAWKVLGAGGSGRDDFARVGGAGSFMAVTPAGQPVLQSGRSTLGQVLDGTTMVLMELSFVMLWAGLVMGAIWADHSWGRPWGWDPKEVFALNTFIVFAVLVHVRLKTRDKGLWTALIALVGAGVMLFNWIAINFVITGLHSYA